MSIYHYSGNNTGYYTEIISSFFDHHLQSYAEAVKAYIKDTNIFFKELRFLPKLLHDIILCTMDVLYGYYVIFRFISKQAA